jgi:hypothetical protein
MGVLVLGAGASVSAGYPLTVNLLKEIQNRIDKSRDPVIQEQWKKWEDFRGQFKNQGLLSRILTLLPFKGSKLARRSQSQGLISSILHAKNPEVALSILDLCGIALQDDSVKKRLELSIRDHDLAFQEVWEGNPLSTDSCTDADIRDIFETSLVRNPLRQCLSWYFAQRHAEDASGNYPSMRTPLRKILSTLEKEDVVITFNWDTTVERELGAMKRWNPVTGYGIDFKVDSPHPSEIRILKPHGSVGWRRLGSESMFMDEELLRGFNLGFENETWFRTISPENINTFEKMTRSLFEYPTFLKETGHRAYLDIWSEALYALSQAKQVDVWGYSFPSADSAAVVLMSSLLVRLKRARVITDVQITIHDPSETTRNRWRDFFGLTYFMQGIVDLRNEEL